MQTFKSSLKFSYCFLLLFFLFVDVSRQTESFLSMIYQLLPTLSVAMIGIFYLNILENPFINNLLLLLLYHGGQYSLNIPVELKTREKSAASSTS